MPLDTELLKLLKDDPRRGIKQIFHTYYANMVGTSFNVVKVESVAKDIAQDVLIKLWENRDQIKINRSLKNYLKRAVINHSINFLKSKYNQNNADLDHIELEDADTEQKIESHDLDRFIRNQIDELPERCRLVFILSRYEDLTNKEIAEHLDISIKTVESQITKALKHLRKTVLPHIHYGVLLFFVFQFSL